MNDRDFQHPIVIPIPFNATAEDLDDALARIEPNRVRESTSFVFRVTSDFVLTFLYDRARRARESVLHRAGDRPVCLLSYSADSREHVILGLTRKGTIGVEHPIKSLRQIGEAELCSILRDAGDRCVFQAGHSFHFVTPAGNHVERFIRVADAIRSRDALDRIAFWLLPKIASNDAIIVDTWGIATVVLRAMQLAKLALPFDCLPSHPQEDSDGTRAVLEGLIQNPGVKRILLIVSITGSGRLVKKVSEIAKTFSSIAPELTALSIYSVQSTPENFPSLCKLPDNSVAYHSVEECNLCSQGSKPLYLESDLYYLKTREEKPILLKDKVFEDGKKFAEQYCDIPGALRVHCQDPNDGRHHGFDVDVCTLLDRSDLADRFRSRLTELTCPEIIVAPPHTAGERLAKIAKDVFPNATVIIQNDLRKQRVPIGEQAALTSCSNLLIVDDVLNSGSRLENYNRSLREDFPTPGFKTVTYLACISRSQSKREYDQVVRGLTQKHQWKANVLEVERIFLPHWKREDCPWCKELEFLMKVAATMPTPPAWLDGRIARLTSSVGLMDEPLFMVPGVECPTLGNASPVAPAGSKAMHVLYSVAIGLQVQRTTHVDSERLGEQFPTLNVFGIENWEHRYTEGLLRSILLRCVKRSEWGESNQSLLQAKILKDISSTDQMVVRGEILCALGRNAIRAFSASQFESLFAQSLGESLPHFLRVLNLSR